MFFAVLVIAPAIASASPHKSNPAFLGVGPFRDLPGTACEIDGVSRFGSASDAGIEVGDLVVAIDDRPLVAVQPCQQMVDAIIAHEPGDRVRIEVRRGDHAIVANATLTTRAEVLQKRVGVRMESTALIDADDPRRTIDLSERHNATTIVGWFTKPCAGCAGVFDRVNDSLSKRLHATPRILAVETYEPDPLADHDVAKELAALRKDFVSSVPLAVADSKTVDSLAMLDGERVFFMVIDCRGLVQFVAPVAPDADDLDAALDEVLAAAEQAEHARTTRR